MVKIIFEQDNNKLEDITLKKMEEVLCFALQAENISLNANIEVSLSLADENQIKELNKKFRNIDKVTDVLSFPQFESAEEIKNFIEFNMEMPVELGDVVICQTVAEKQAKEFGHSTQREIVYLFAHSILHLIGYDHMNESDKIKMRMQEKKLMKEIDLLK